MTEPILSNSAPATVGAGTTITADAERTATLVPRPRRHHLGPIHVLQLVLIEAVLLAILAATYLGPLAVAVTVLVGLALVGIALARYHGRWLLERRLMVRRYRRRRRRRSAGRTDDARLIALRSLAPGLSVRNVPAPDGSQVGIARDDTGWFAVAAVTATAAMRDEPNAGLPIDRLARLIADAGTQGAVLQVVTHTVPAPSLNIDPGCAADQSYRELLEASNATSVPLDQVTWLAVRLDARELAEDNDDDGGQAEPPAVLTSLIRRVVTMLRRTGRTWHILDADGIVTALARSCDLDATSIVGSPRSPSDAPSHVQAKPRPGGSSSSASTSPRENWISWHSARLAHASYWVRHWPQADQAGDVIGRLALVPATLTSVAVILTPGQDAVDLRCLVRVAAPPAKLSQISEGLVNAARQARAEVLRLDGEQGPAAYATAPTGGGAG